MVHLCLLFTSNSCFSALFPHFPRIFLSYQERLLLRGVRLVERDFKNFVNWLKISNFATYIAVSSGINRFAVCKTTAKLIPTSTHHNYGYFV